MSIMSVDPDSVSAALSEGGKNGRLKLEQYFNLKFCMPDVSSMEIGKYGKPVGHCLLLIAHRLLLVAYCL